MLLNSLDGKLRLGLSTLLLLGVFLAPGCASWDTATDIENAETDTGWASQFRSDSSDGQQTGLAPEAREIEASLGVQ